MSEGSPTSFVAGWYGKMPCLGDFASRRLPPDFISNWDAWLQESLAASRQELGSRWLDTYLKSPIWRFALMPGACDERAWAGLLMPSVDKIGRHFPLTLALALHPESHFGGARQMLAAQDWYSELEEIALCTLDAAFSPEDLERELAEVPFPDGDSKPSFLDGELDAFASWWRSESIAPNRFRLSAASFLSEAPVAIAAQLFADHARGKSIWWSEAVATGRVDVHCFNRLPAHDYFAVLLGEEPHGSDVSV